MNNSLEPEPSKNVEVEVEENATDKAEVEKNSTENASGEIKKKKRKRFLFFDLPSILKKDSPHDESDMLISSLGLLLLIFGVLIISQKFEIHESLFLGTAVFALLYGLFSSLDGGWIKNLFLRLLFPITAAIVFTLLGLKVDLQDWNNALSLFALSFTFFFLPDKKYSEKLNKKNERLLRTSLKSKIRVNDSLKDRLMETRKRLSETQRKNSEMRILYRDSLRELREKYQEQAELKIDKRLNEKNVENEKIKIENKKLERENSILNKEIFALRNELNELKYPEGD